MRDIKELREQAKFLGIEHIPSHSEPGIKLAEYLLNLEDRIIKLEKELANIKDGK